MKYFSKDRFCNFNIHYEAFFPFRYFCECMEKLGIRNAELIAGHQSLFMDDKHISNLTEQKKLLREHNIKVGSLCAQSCRFQYQFSAKEEDLREASFNFFSNGIKVAAELGAPLLQVNTGWGYMNEPKEEVFKRMTEMFGRLCDIGEKCGINIACESLRPQESLAGATVRDIRKLYDILNHPRCKVMIDTCAMGVSGETIQDWFDAFPAEDIIHTHFQDGTPYFHLVYGDGKRSLNDDLKALYDNGYKGLISQELTLARYYQDPFEADKRSIAAFSEYLY